MLAPIVGKYSEMEQNFVIGADEKLIEKTGRRLNEFFDSKKRHKNKT